MPDGVGTDNETLLCTLIHRILEVDAMWIDLYQDISPVEERDNNCKLGLANALRRE